MSSLFDSLSEGFKKNTPIEKQGSFASSKQNFLNDLSLYKNIVVNNHNKYGTDLNESIAKLALENNLNDNQISRIIEEANNNVFLIKYARLKRYPERDVSFNLAKLPEIKEMMSDKVAKKNNNNIEKEASDKSKAGKTEKLNFLNYTAYETPSLALDTEKTAREIVAEKLSKELTSLDDEIKNSLAESAENIYTVAEALIQYDKINKNAQDIFCEMCKKANVTKKEQLLYKKAIDQKITQMKEAKSIHSSYDLNLDLVDINEKDEFSLGKYSFIEKKALDDTPPIFTENKALIKNVADLINRAEKAKIKSLKAQELKTKKIDMQNKLKGADNNNAK